MDDTTFYYQRKCLTEPKKNKKKIRKKNKRKNRKKIEKK